MTDRPQQIAYDILTYLAENPDAQDTLKGISEWWLSGRADESNISEVEEAINRLMADGLIVARRRGGPQTYYKVDRRRLKEIERLLTRFKGSDAPRD